MSETDLSLIPISVVITTYNDDLRLRATLTGFKRQSVDSFEVIVVDDGGTSVETKSIVESLGGRYFYLDPPTPDFRLAKARNLGLKNSRGSHIIICDCDTIPERDFVAKHAEHIKSYSVCAGVRKRIAIEDSDNLIKSSDWDYALLELLFYKVDERLSNPDYMNLAKNPMPWMYTWGCNFSFPARPALQIGGFDEDFVGWGGEDEDLANRLFRCGLRFVPLAECNVYHLDHPPRTTQKAAATFNRKLGGPLVRNGGPIIRNE